MLDKASPMVVKPEEAFRPICVSSTIIKIQEASIINKLRAYVKKYVHWSQCGFIGGRSCAHNLVRLHMLRTKYPKGFILAIDWSSAYNRTLRKAIFQRQERDKVLDKNELKMLAFILTNLELGIVNKSTKTEISLQQGLSTSPQQYVLEMDIQIGKLREAGVGDCLALADDLLIYIYSLDQLYKAIRIIKEFEFERKQKQNPKKCGILEVGKRMKKSRVIKDEVQGIPNCTDIGYKYLGVDVTKNINYQAYVQNKRRKIWSVVSAVKRYTETWSLSKKRLIVKSLILPHIDYIGMLQLLGKKTDMEKFKASIRRFIRVIFGLGYNVKCELVNLLVDVNREKLWQRRLTKIKNDWEQMAGYKWHLVNKVCDEQFNIVNKEIDLKDINKENQNLMIEIFNKFNRVFCKDHNNKRLSTSHLKEHDYVLDYKIIIEIIIKQEWSKQRIIKNKINELELNTD